MRKKIIVILLTALLFLSAAGLGVATVFRVDVVTLDTSRITRDSDEEAQALLARLKEAYVDESIFTVKRSTAEQIMPEFPYFRITGFTRSYPNRLVIEVAEDEEVYAVETGNENGKYYILNGKGTVLGVRDDATNRLDGNRNVLLKGLTVSGEKGSSLLGDEYLNTVFALCGKISEQLNGIRGNVLEIEVLWRVSEGAVIVLRMQEGVNVYVYNAEDQTNEKAIAAVNAYLALSVEEKMCGRLQVVDGIDGKISVAYYDEDFSE